jgi:hypothetical protein
MRRTASVLHALTCPLFYAVCRRCHGRLVQPVPGWSLSDWVRSVIVEKSEGVGYRYVKNIFKFLTHLGNQIYGKIDDKNADIDR